MSEVTCPSCNVALSQHAGSIKTCAELMAAKRECASLRDAVAIAREERDKEYEFLRTATTGWDAANKRRAELIDKEIEGTASSEEMAELGELQRMADFRAECCFPINPWEQIDPLLSTLEKSVANQESVQAEMAALRAENVKLRKEMERARRDATESGGFVYGLSAKHWYDKYCEVCDRC